MGMLTIQKKILKENAKVSLMKYTINKEVINVIYTLLYITFKNYTCLLFKNYLNSE